MCEACNLRSDIARLEERRHRIAALANKYEHTDPRRCEYLDQLHDEVENAITHLERDLDELEQEAAEREAALDRAFGRWMTA
jgi:DNA repair ATPase RecN